MELLKSTETAVTYVYRRNLTLALNFNFLIPISLQSNLLLLVFKTMIYARTLKMKLSKYRSFPISSFKSVKESVC